MLIKSLKPIARHHCANWDAGKCRGVIFHRVDGNLAMHIDRNYRGKDCFVNSDEGCEYFEKIVIKGIK